MPGREHQQVPAADPPVHGIPPTSTPRAHEPSDPCRPPVADSERDAGESDPTHNHATQGVLKPAPPPRSQVLLPAPGAGPPPETPPARFCHPEIPKNPPAAFPRDARQPGSAHPVPEWRTRLELGSARTSGERISQPVMAGQHFPHTRDDDLTGMAIPQRSGTTGGSSSAYPALVRRNSPTVASLSRRRSA
jgi:hypothetical protein